MKELSHQAASHLTRVANLWALLSSLAEIPLPCYLLCRSTPGSEPQVLLISWLLRGCSLLEGSWDVRLGPAPVPFGIKASFWMSPRLLRGGRSTNERLEIQSLLDVVIHVSSLTLLPGHFLSLLREFQTAFMADRLAHLCSRAKLFLCVQLIFHLVPAGPEMFSFLSVFPSVSPCPFLLPFPHIVTLPLTLSVGHKEAVLSMLIMENG